MDPENGSNQVLVTGGKSASHSLTIIVGSTMLILGLVGGFFLCSPLNKFFYRDVSKTDEQKEVLAPSQKYLGVENTELVTPAPPFYKKTDAGLSPSVSAKEMGKKYQASFPSHIPAGGQTNLTVTILKAEKYYPIQVQNPDSKDSVVYFPICSAGCSGSGLSIRALGVESSKAIIALSLEFENQTSGDVVYLRGSNSRFKAEEKYLTSSENPDLYINPATSQTVIFWVEVPHNQENIVFMYSGNADTNDLSFSPDNLSLVVPLTFPNLTGDQPTGVSSSLQPNVPVSYVSAPPFGPSNEIICQEDDFDCMLAASVSCRLSALDETPKGVFPSRAHYEILGYQNGNCHYRESIVGQLILSNTTPKKIVGIDSSGGNSMECISSTSELTIYLKESFKQIRDLRSGVDDPNNYTKTDDFIAQNCEGSFWIE